MIKLLRIRLGGELGEQLARYCEVMKMSPSEVVRRALQEFFAMKRF